MKFGNYPSNAVTPIAETYYQQTPNTLLYSNENFYALGSFTMPFFGHLFIDLWAEMKWPGENTAVASQVWLSVGSNSSPAPGYTADLGWCQGVEGYEFTGEQELRTHAGWYSLGAGQVVTAYGRLYTTGLGVVTVVYLGGWWRPLAL